MLLRVQQAFRRWLGIEDLYARWVDLEARVRKLDLLTRDLVSIGVDVHFKEPHMILIYSRLAGGQIREVRAHFKDLRELQQCVQGLEERYATAATTWDVPHGLGQFREHR